MKELSEVVSAKINEMIETGKVEEMIADKLEETIKESVNSAMRSYSDFGKAITDKISESIQTAGRDIKIPSYNRFIADVVTEKFTQVLEENAASHLAEVIEESIPAIKKEAKASDLISYIQERWSDEARENDRDTLEIESEENSDGTALYVTLKKPNEDYIKVSFYNFRNQGAWHIGYINERDNVITGRPINIAATYMDDVTKRLYQYYAMQTVFEMDAEFEEIDICYY